MRSFRAQRLERAFRRLLDDPDRRRALHERQSRIDFHANKARVVRSILDLLRADA